MTTPHKFNPLVPIAIALALSMVAIMVVAMCAPDNAPKPYGVVAKVVIKRIIADPADNTRTKVLEVEDYYIILVRPNNGKPKVKAVQMPDKASYDLMNVADRIQEPD